MMIVTARGWVKRYPKKEILNKDIKSFGKLMNESHQSYAKDFEASTEDVDLIVAKSITSGAEGARLTGGGFGGFTVSLIHKNKFDEWKKNMKKFIFIFILISKITLSADLEIKNNIEGDGVEILNHSKIKVHYIFAS